MDVQQPAVHLTRKKSQEWYKIAAFSDEERSLFSKNWQASFVPFMHAPAKLPINIMSSKLENIMGDSKTSNFSI